MPTDKVQVAVRVRPINKREIELSTKCVVDMQGNQTILYHPSDSPLDSGGGGGGTDRGRRKAPKTFAFDHCFWSMEKDDPKFCSQENVFNHLGESVLQRAFEGYNGCIFAYGQTGSGKSYTMMGTAEDKGIIPRLCDSLFESILRLEDESTSFKVEVSYMEIYNEKVHDLLDPKGSKQNLKVREHNILGPYVDGLSTLVVESFEDINNLMSEGNKSRTVAATNMNSESSRSHAVFNIILTQTLVDLKTSVSGEKVSKLSLVDLAGSERAQKTGAMGDRLREGSNINKSLTTLGLVISALADQGGGGGGGKSKNKFVPYRDSVLTWLLKDNLGGNSKTVMVATVSPAADNYEETLSSLRYADRAKRIVNHAVVNEDPNARIIRELRCEVETLHKELEKAQSMKAPDLKEKLEESEKLLKEMRKTWEEKLAETEKIHQERHQALIQMGVSVETSGIKVEHGRYFLVNLNADPSLNELLVYYLKEQTVVGCPNSETTPDIQLSGLGIQPEHSIVEIEDGDVFVSPFEGARTCVNGSVIQQRTRVKHGDRILWGNNHFFRINCPVQNNVSMTQPDADETIDYNYAQQELMLKEFSNDPISEAISAVEQQYEEDKQEALEKQRQMYERQMQMLRYQLMSPGTPSMPFPPIELSKLTPTGSQSGIQRKYQQWAQERDKMFKQSLCKLREEVVKANALVREANFLAEEMGKHTEFHVTLQIPAANLSPNRRKGAFVSEPAILVRRKHRSSQIWSMEKFENKIIDMRDMYEERKRLGVPIMVDDSDESESDEGPPQKGDPFYESHENHNLIGVANVFLDCLFYDVKLDYHVPIISQQGEVAGKLHVEISKLGGAIMDRYADINCDDSVEEDEDPLPAAKPLVIRVKIHEARSLPKDLSHFVFCQYSFWGYEDPISVPPYINPDTSVEKKNTKTVKFTHERDFKVYMSEEFIEHCQEGALSIEVWGHKSLGFGHQNSVRDSVSRTNSLADRWDEVTRKIELWVEIHEVNDQGEYAPVEVKPQPEVPSAGAYQLRQGHARRILTRVKPTANSGTLPLICESITSVSVGCVCSRSKLQKGLDSYQEEDLNLLRERWSEALSRRHEYLDSHIHKLINKQDKTESDCDRERALIDQWVSLTEERNAVLVPAAGSGIPGAPANWEAPPDMEQHRPVLFLDLNSDDMTTPTAKEGLQAAGINSILPKEQSANYIALPIIKTYMEKENVCAVTSWDSSMHDCPHLNRLTNANDRVYMILKAVIRLSHPAYMELVLRKRLCINIKQRNMSLTDKLKKRWIGTEGLKASGITYDVVSNIPKASEDLEEMETLAQMAASQNEVSAADGETYIEKYIKGVSAVESILTLDRLRQEVAVKELMTAQGRPLQRTTSVPNMHQFVTTPPRLDEKMRFDSIQDLSFLDKKSGNSSATSPAPGRSAMSPLGAKIPLMKPLQTLQEEHRESRPLLQKESEEEDDASPLKPHPPKPQESALNTARDSVHMKLNIEPDPSSVGSDDFQEFESYQSQQVQKTGVPHSGTSDSIAEGQFKGTPSMTSSGYGSQAVSTLTLSSEDSLSLRSNDDSEMTKARKSGIEHTSSGESDGDEAVQVQSVIVVNRDEEKSLKSEDSQATLIVEAENESTDSMESQKEIVVEDSKLIDKKAEEGITIDSGVDKNRLESTGFEAIMKTDKTEVKDDSLAVNELNKDVEKISLSTDSDDEDEVMLPESLKLHISEEDLRDENGDVGNKKIGKDMKESRKDFVAQEDGNKIDSVSMNQNIISDRDESLPKHNEPQNKLAEERTKDTAACLSVAESDRDTGLHETAAGDLEDKSQNVVNTSHKMFDKLDDMLQKGNTSEASTDISIDILNSDRLPSASDSSSVSSRGVLGSDSIDPYSLEAMDELERLGAECGEDNSEFLSVDEKLDNSSINQGNKSLNQSGKGGLDDSLGGYDKALPKNQSTPKGAKGGNPRPVSCIGFSQKEINEAFQEASNRLSGDFSDTVSEDSMSVCSFGSRADLDRLQEVPVPSWIQVGESVIVTSSRTSAKMTGVVQFVGNVEFAHGPWVGVELDLPEGKNDGSVNHIRYFRCRPRHGIFVRHDKLIWDKKRKGSRKMAAMNRRSLNAQTVSPLSKGGSGVGKRK